ncbi:MAG: sulfatase-like hydrolase/transferase [Kiritimatiellae bacterium]|nr:sulfatase-like hydrolase/transferase [Kiritimatiellia bacterium]
MNVLLIGQDMFRPQLACNGLPGMVTPHFDRLAGSAAHFTRNACQIAPCAPSRASTLSGCRPETTRVFTNEGAPLGVTMPEVVTVSHQFKRNGYTSIGISQVFHHMNRDDPHGWSEPLPKKLPVEHQLPENRAIVEAKLAAAGFTYGDYSRRMPKELWPPVKLGPETECADVPDDAYRDGKTTRQAIERLQQLREGPFFLAVGYTATHHPWFAPKRHWDLYADDTLEQMGSTTPRGSEKRTIEHAYCACISFLDAQLGMLLDELDRLGLTDNTIVALWADHAGSAGMLRPTPAATFHVPLMIRDPRVRPHRIDALTENVDLYPTLCDLCGVPLPEHLEGVSLAPLMQDPNRPWKSATFSEIHNGDRVRHTLCTARYELRFERQQGSDAFEHVKVFDVGNGFDPAADLAALPENGELVNTLLDQWKAGWRAALPHGRTHAGDDRAHVPVHG